MNPELEKFAEILVRTVRDASIKSCDRALTPDYSTPVADRWKVAMKNESIKDYSTILISDVVDETIFHFLNALDQGVLRLEFLTAAHNKLDLTKDGLSELAGFYMGSGGWRSTYSKERFVDDFKDLA